MASITKKDMLVMDQTASSIKGVLDNLKVLRFIYMCLCLCKNSLLQCLFHDLALLQVQLQIVNDDIKASEKSKKEFERILTRIENRRSELESRIQRTSDGVEPSAGSAAYDEMTQAIGSIYENARKVSLHANCVDHFKCIRILHIILYI